MNIGEKIREKRKQMNITQTELAKGICTQALISKIELNLVNPSRTIIEQIARKLNVSVEFFKFPIESSNEIVRKVFDQIFNELNKNDYKSAYKIYDNNRQFFVGINEKQYIYTLKLIESILDYYYFHLKDKGINTLVKLLDDSVKMGVVQKINVYSTLGTFYYDNEDIFNANKLFEQCNSLIDNNFTEDIPYRVLVKFYYNYALVLDSKKEYDKALELTLTAIEILVSEQSMYSLGYLYQLRGYLFKEIGNLDETIDSYQTASEIFKILNYKKMYSIVQSNLTKNIEERRQNSEK